MGLQTDAARSLVGDHIQRAGERAIAGFAPPSHPSEMIDDECVEVALLVDWGADELPEEAPHEPLEAARARYGVSGRFGVREIARIGCGWSRGQHRNAVARLIECGERGIVTGIGLAPFAFEPRKQFRQALFAHARPLASTAGTRLPGSRRGDESFNRTARRR